jgi:radical SAM protein with 4Fe4S-binding SPASM domain
MSDQDPSYIPINKGQFSLETPEREAQFESKRGFGVEEDYKENRKLWTQHPKSQHVSNYPLHVDIELASVCNLQCPMCYTITPDFKKKVNTKLMDYELFTKIVDECAIGGVYSIRLSFRGESFLHKRIVDCVHYAKKKGIKEVSTLTNGLRLDEELFGQLMEADLDWITISFDGLGDTYEQIRRPAKYDRAIEKIANYARLKKNAGRVKPVVKIQTILPAIEKDPQAFYDVFKPISDMVCANPLIDFHQDVARLPKAATFVCPQIYQRLVIGADGFYMMCMNDTSNTVAIGDAYKQSIHEVWHGPEMTRIREIHKQHKGCEKLDPCKQCNLPIDTYDEEIELGGRKVVAEKYKLGAQKVYELQTPAKFRRKNLEV